MNKQRRLGRGLAALLGEPAGEQRGSEGALASPHQTTRDQVHQPALPSDAPSSDGGAPAQGDEGILKLNVYEIDGNPFQPRRSFSESEIASLAESLKEHDMLQPVLVRRTDNGYQLISGERRLRAAIKAGWSTVPARLREADDRLVAELAIVENLQRKDLNPMEKALSFQRYLDEHRCTQEDLARRIKVDRSTISNLMRLLELPEPVKEAVRGGTITAGHARSLLPLGEEAEQIAFYQRIQNDGLSVRQTERLVQEAIQQADAEPLSMADDQVNGPRRKRTVGDQIASLEQELQNVLGTKVDVRQTARGRGRIVIHFSRHEEFERLHSLLTTTSQQGHTRAG